MPDKKSFHVFCCMLMPTGPSSVVGFNSCFTHILSGITGEHAQEHVHTTGGFLGLGPADWCMLMSC